MARDGYHAARAVTTAAGRVPVRRPPVQPRVTDNRADPMTGERRRFASAILPASVRKSPQLAEVLPLLYLHGLSCGDVVAGLEQFLGSDCGLSARTIGGLVAQWQGHLGAFQNWSLAGVDYVYVWVEGIDLKVRLEQEWVGLLVMVGVRCDGRKELIALADGFGESARSWAELLRDCRGRGMTAPVLAVGDGGLGFWQAVGEVFPETREQRCWLHTSAAVLARLPTGVRAGAVRALRQIYTAADRCQAVAAARAFVDRYEPLWPAAAARLTDDLDRLLAFYDYPVEHWVHLRTTNPIESTFATVRLRDRVIEGPGSRAAGIAMAYKLIESAQYRWRAINAPRLVPLVRAGAEFHNGRLVEHPAGQDQQPGDQQVWSNRTPATTAASISVDPALRGSSVECRSHGHGRYQAGLTAAKSGGERGAGLGGLHG